MIDAQSKKTNHWLWLILITTVSLTIWTSMQSEPDDTDSTIELAEPSVTDGAKKIPNKSITTESAQNEPLRTEPALMPWNKSKRDSVSIAGTNDLFKPHSWMIIPPAPKVKPVPPPPPVAPPSPFTYFGKMEDGPKCNLLFLIANNKVYSVKKGEKIDALWRLDSEDANNIYMTYLPLNLPQILSKSQKASAPVVTPAEVN